jgi:hypothetical protein
MKILKYLINTIIILVILIILLENYFLYEIPELYYSPTLLNKKIVNSFSILKEYKASFVSFHGFIHLTYINLLRKGKEYKYKKKVLINKYGQEISIYIKEPKLVLENTTSILVITGVAGHKNKSYMKNFVQNTDKKKYRIIIYNHIGI